MNLWIKMTKRLIIVTNSQSNLLNFRGDLIKKLIDENFQVLVIIPKSDFSTELSKSSIKIRC